MMRLVVECKGMDEARGTTKSLRKESGLLSVAGIRCCPVCFAYSSTPWVFAPFTSSPRSQPRQARKLAQILPRDRRTDLIARNLLSAFTVPKPLLKSN